MELKFDHIYCDDIFNVMPNIADKSIDMILTDMPYNTTACDWDKEVIPLDKLWEGFKRIIKDNGAIVMTASQPFTSKLIMSNLKMFKYCWTWKKNFPTGMAFANFQPMRVTEDVCVFSKSKTVFNKQLINCSPSVKKAWKDGEEMKLPSQVGVYSEHMTNKAHKVRYKINPINFLDIKCVNRSTGTLHPTQKPVALFEYLIKTYTNENDIVFDGFAGSGTTGIACQNLNRKFILVEKEEKYCKIARDRLKQCVLKL